MNKLLENNINKNIEFNEILKDIINNPTVQKMKIYRQHYNTSCYEHCFIVAFYVYSICKKLNLNYIDATKAAMLHDLFLYDWRKRQNGRKGLHAFTHGNTSYENASKLFELNELQQDMIVNHMWPLTIKFPKYAETYILTFVDKYCAFTETISEMISRLESKTVYIKTYMLFSNIIN